MWLFRPAQAAEAAEACTVIRRSIEDLCGADHGGDPAILGHWLANKTPERVRSWIDANPTGVIVAVGAGIGVGAIAGVGCIMPDGTIALNYVAPWQQRHGVGRGLLRSMEQVAMAAGSTVCTLTSTTTAHGFYLAHGYEDVGEPVAAFAGMPAFRMRRALL